MGTDSIFKDCYITVVYGDTDTDCHGRMVESFKTKEDALNHIRYQKEVMKSYKHWSILHIKDMEWLSVNLLPC